MTRSRRPAVSIWERRHTAALAVPVALLLVWLVLYPNLLVLAESIREEGRLTLAHYADFFSTRAELAALWASVWTSLASVALAALIGVPLAMFFHRFDFPGRRVFGALAALRAGFSPEGCSWPWASRRPHGGWPVPRRSSSRTVTLPLLIPSLTAAALLVFMTSMASFSAPYVFGGGFRVLTTQIYASKMSGALSMAMVETVMLASASLVALWFLRRYEEAREYVVVGKGVAPARHRVRSPGVRALLAAAGAGWVLLLLLPHLTLVLVSFVADGGWTTQLLPERYSLENYRGLLRDPRLFAPILNSLQMAAVATAANLVFCFVAAYLVVRRRFRGRAWLAVLLVLPWALPGTVIAIGLATTFSANQPLTGRFVLVGTFWILPLAYFIRNIPLVAQAVISAFRRFDPTLEEAAASLGAGWLTTMRRVALPLVTPGLAAGGLLAFVTALGEFVASILLYTPRSRPISIEILAQLRAFDFGGAAALGVVLALLMASVFVIGGRFVRDGVGAPGG
jgi:iron(III) transport system permease protein